MANVVDFPPSDDVVNRSIARLQDQARDWKAGTLDLAHWANRIRGWADDLWSAFIPTCWGDRLIEQPQLLLAFRRERACVLGHYRPGRNDTGLRFEVSVNPRHLLAQPEADVAATVLHELLHCYEDLAGTARLHRSNYHSSWFRQTASAIGIPCTRYGADLGIREASPFAEWIERQGLRTSGMAAQAVTESVGVTAVNRDKPKRVVWTCDCPKATVVSLLVAAGADLLARCERCGGRFRRRSATS